MQIKVIFNWVEMNHSSRKIDGFALLTFVRNCFCFGIRCCEVEEIFFLLFFFIFYFTFQTTHGNHGNDMVVLYKRIQQLK